jgi:hypothetical protein
MEPLDPDFEYPLFRENADQLNQRVGKWSSEDESALGNHVTLADLHEIINDLKGQVQYYEANRATIILPDLSKLVKISIEENTYILYYHYKLLRQILLQKRLSASQIIRELIDNYEKAHGIEENP